LKSEFSKTVDSVAPAIGGILGRGLAVGAERAEIQIVENPSIRRRIEESR
jgi:hypothetical protein